MFELPHAAHLAKARKNKPKPILAAQGQLRFATASSGLVQLKLTAGGKRLCKHARRGERPRRFRHALYLVSVKRSPTLGCGIVEHRQLAVVGGLVIRMRQNDVLPTTSRR